MPENKSDRILVVDDDDAKRYALVRILRSEHFDVQEAADGGSALRLVGEQPDLVMLDVRLPDISGLEVCRQIRSNPATARIPIMHVSGTFVTPEHRVRGLDSGADAYLSDSASAGELLATVRALLRTRKAEQVALESQQRYRTLIEVIPQFVWSCNADGACEYLSPPWVAYTGVPAEQHLGRGWVGAIHPDDRAAVEKRWQSAVQERESFDAEFRIRRHDGIYRWFQTRGAPLRDEEGRVTNWFGTCTDIQLEKEAAAERAILLNREKAAREEAERANQLKDDFLATLSHELRTPLMAILGWAELLQTGKMSAEETDEGVKTIHRNAWAQSQLIDDLLDVSRIISGKMRLDVQPVDMHAVIQAAIESIRNAADAKEIHLVQLLDPAAGRIAGDAGRLQQVIWNLLSNAIKFTPRHGRVSIQLARVDSQVELTVADSGQGIDPAFLPHVFERFRQQDASSRRSQGGLGLGLAIVRNLVELHGGSIAAHSEGLNKGAAFTVRLPVAAIISPWQDGKPPRSLGSAEPAEHFHPTQDLAGVNVLLVDDEQDARDVLAKTLEQRNAQVVTAGSVDEAVRLFRASRPDVLISDIGMPDQDGFDLIRRIRATEEGQHRVPAVALTAFARAEDRQRVLMAGFQAHVSKPVIPSELVAIIASLVHKS
jgi:PAS domain S-box-containing protein